MDFGSYKGATQNIDAAEFFHDPAPPFRRLGKGKTLKIKLYFASIFLNFDKYSIIRLAYMKNYKFEFMLQKLANQSWTNHHPS